MVTQADIYNWNKGSDTQERVVGGDSYTGYDPPNNPNQGDIFIELWPTTARVKETWVYEAPYWVTLRLFNDSFSITSAISVTRSTHSFNTLTVPYYSGILYHSWYARTSITTTQDAENNWRFSLGTTGGAGTAVWDRYSHTMGLTNAATLVTLLDFVRDGVVHEPFLTTTTAVLASFSPLGLAAGSLGMWSNLNFRCVRGRNAYALSLVQKG